MSDREYSYGTGYYVVAGWEGICSILALGLILYKCRIPHTNVFLWLPMIPFALAIVYAVCYVRGVYWVWLLAGDITVSLCLLIAAIFESCIQCRLILSNQGYETLLALTTVPTQITDQSYQVRYASETVSPLSRSAMEQAVSNAYALDKHTVLKGHPVEKGYVFWQEDITELVEVADALQITQSELRDTGDVLKAESEQKARWLRLTEQNRLYDLIEQQTACQMQLLDRLLGELRNAENLERAKRILGQIVVIGTYIKRRSNLIFVSGQRQTVAAEELRLCLSESISNLRLYGVECQANLELKGQLRQETAYMVYDLFEAIVEATLPELSSLLFYAGAQDDAGSVRIGVLGGEENAELQKRCPNAFGAGAGAEITARYRGAAGDPTAYLSLFGRLHFAVYPGGNPGRGRPPIYPGDRVGCNGAGSPAVYPGGGKSAAGGCKRTIAAADGTDAGDRPGGGDPRDENAGS